MPKALVWKVYEVNHFKNLVEVNLAERHWEIQKIHTPLNFSQMVQFVPNGLKLGDDIRTSGFRVVRLT
jgi:hypothetical protein